MSTKVSKIICRNNQFAVDYFEGDLRNPDGSITAYVLMNDPINQHPYQEFPFKTEELQKHAAAHHWFDWTMEYKEHDTAQAKQVEGVMDWEEFITQPEQVLLQAMAQFIQAKYNN